MTADGQQPRITGDGRRPQKICIYPGCDRPAVPAHVLGGPQPSFCDSEQHNALTAHQERRRLAHEGTAAGSAPEPGQSQ